jgi:alpha-L-fucosidase
VLTWESLGVRAVPDWFQDAKLGVLVPWGPYSVPAWAPLSGNPSTLVTEEGWEQLLANDPRAEWYANGLHISGSPTAEHHHSTWGRLSRYESFGRLFRQGLKAWEPAPLVDTLASVGARYLVFCAKHHDGFLLWPSRRKNSRRREWQTTMDVVGAFAEIAQGLGMRFGVYYSGGLDWSFGGLPIRSLDDLLEAIPTTKTYASYVDAHMRELITRYSPSILWNDVCCPARQDVLSLLDFYYHEVPDGVINDRFGQYDPEETTGLFRRLKEALQHLYPVRRRTPSAHASAAPTPRHLDFKTAENGDAPSDEEGAWERVRAVGFSSSCNSAETEESLLSVAGLVHLLVDTVAHGGNLLLSVGPDASGQVPELTSCRLRGFGDWLKRNGEAIYSTRRWEVTEAVTDEGIEVRYTKKGMTVYAILLGTPSGRAFILPSLRLLPYASLRILGSIGHAAWFQEGRDIQVRLSEPLRESPAHVISITPAPRLT